MPCAMPRIYHYLLYSQWPSEAQQLIAGYTPPVSAPDPSQTHQEDHKIFNVSALEDTPVHIDKDGNAYVTLNQRQMGLLSSVRCQLLYISKELDIIMALGSDSNIIANWNTGIMRDNFNGKWPMLNGTPVYIEITSENDGYNLYSVPIKLNGMECNLQVIYDFSTERYSILGARKGIDNHGMGDRNLIKIKPGDTITPLHYAMTLSGNEKEFTLVDVDTFTAGSNLTMKDEDVGDGTYAYFFEFVAPNSDTALSNMTNFTIKNGTITT